MKYDNKGFTLIELLSVIIILAVIALISTPIILEIIEKSKEQAAVDSAYAYIDAIEMYMALSELENGLKINSNTKYFITENSIYREENDLQNFDYLNTIIKVKGNEPDDGYVILNKKGNKISEAKLLYKNIEVECDESRCRATGRTNLKDSSIKIYTEPSDGVGITATISIDFGNLTSIEYKVGKITTEWTEYSEPFLLTSETALALKLQNEDYSITICARGMDGEQQEELCKNIYVLDLDPSDVPIISTNDGYPVLTEYGISYETTIDYGTRKDVNNYYSLDGKNWIEYTSGFETPSGIIYAKSVKKNTGLTTYVSETVMNPSDSMPSEAYDGVDSTYVSSNKLLYLKVDQTAIGMTISYLAYHANYSGNTTQYLKYLDEDKNEIETIFTKTNTGNNYSFSGESVIPEGTVYIAYNAKYTGNKLYKLELK